MPREEDATMQLGGDRSNKGTGQHQAATGPSIFTMLDSVVNGVGSNFSTNPGRKSQIEYICSTCSKCTHTCTPSHTWTPSEIYTQRDNGDVVWTMNAEGDDPA
ncbi:hypothetical protein ACLKA7_014504 [Drosophila subpalustris]